MSRTVKGEATPWFIVLEGLDGAGTTTQSERLARALRSQGRQCHQTCEPSRGPIGEMIRQMLRLEIGIEDEQGGLRPVGRETLALLFAADRLHHVEAEIEPALKEGAVVISDRYYHSSLVYQGDIDPGDGEGEGEKVDYDWVRQINGRARVPDLTIFLEAPVELCLERLQARQSFEIYETREKLTRLERRYAEVMEMLEKEGQRILRLDASLSRESLTERILGALAF